jgi:hypothetical protein
MGSIWEWLWRDKPPGEIVGIIIGILIGVGAIAAGMWKSAGRLLKIAGQIRNSIKKAEKPNLSPGEAKGGMKIRLSSASVNELDQAADTPLRKKIVSLIKLIGEPLSYKPVCKVNPAKEQLIKKDYLPRAVGLEDSIKDSVLDALIKSQTDNKDHSKIRHWGRCAAGIAVHLLWPDEVGSLSETDVKRAADVIARLSGWFHTEGGIWIQFQPTAEKVVELMWGSIDDHLKE